MYTPLNDSLGKEKLIIKAGAATVGRPTGVDGKKRVPRRARVTSKELEKLTTKGLKAGGPGSGRKPVNDEAHKVLTSHGYKHETISDDTYYSKRGSNQSYRVGPKGDWTHQANSKTGEGGTRTGESIKGLKRNLSKYEK